MIYIYAVSDNNKHFSTAIEEYIKRLGKELQIKYIKPSKKDSIGEIKKQESEYIIKELEKVSAYKILLYINAKMKSTEEFYKFIELKKQTQGNIVFVIGGAYGVDDVIVEKCDEKISLSPMTYPHGMALLLLIEQIYRITTMKQGKKYHHE